MDLNKFGKSKIFKGLLIGIGALIVALLIFKAGMLVGYRKADFSFGWGEHYQENFGGPRGGFFRDFRDRDFMDSHGSFGQILKLDGSTIVMKGRDNVEKIILVDDDTVIRSSDQTIKLGDLKVDDYIVVIGQPNNSGQIEAKFVRVMPPPPGNPAPTPPSSPTPAPTNTNQQ